MSQPVFAPPEVFAQMLEFGVMPTFDLLLEYGNLGYIFLKRKIAPYQNVWALPGLRMYKGESIDDTLTRIGQQELGLDIDLKNKQLLGQYVGKFTTEHHRQDLSTAYYIRLSGTEELCLNPEHFSALQISTDAPEPLGAMYAYYLRLRKEGR